MNQGDTRNRKLGRYELREEIGRGGMAVVYRAFDTTLQRDVAIKLLHPHLLTHREARSRFEREAHSVARLKHPAVVGVYDYCETEEGEVFLVMELVQGFTLRQFLDQRGQGENHPVVAETAAAIAREIFVALEVAHNEGIIHRDVKPENILISDKGEIRLSDFGIAYLADIGQMTVTGQILGSPMYMSPEHIERVVVDARADIFSVGIILYEMTVGVLPFPGGNPHQIIKRIVEGYYDHPLSTHPAVGHRVAAIIVRCLQSQPERRFASAGEAIAEIDQALEEMGISSSPETLRHFFKNPDEADAETLRHVIPRTLSLGRSALRGRRLPEAMNHFNRVLALDPGNAVALDSVNALSRRRRFRRSMERAAIVVAMSLTVLSLAALIITGYLPGRTDGLGSHPGGADTAQPPVETSTDRPVAPAVIPTTPATTDTADPPRASLPPDSDGPSPSGDERVRQVRRPPPQTKALTRTVIFNPAPMSVDISIEGGETFTYKTTDRSRELPVGSHRVTFTPRDPRLMPLTVEVNVKPAEEPLSVGARLRWKPGFLLVRSNIAAEVSIDGVTGGKTDAPFQVTFDSNPTRQARILISAEGHRPVSRNVNLQAAQTTELVVHLEKSAN